MKYSIILCILIFLTKEVMINELYFSDKISGLKASAIREILKFTADPR